MKKIVIAFLFIPFLSGCMGDGLGMKESPLWYMTADDSAIEQHFSKLCNDLGYRTGTSEHKRCLTMERRNSSSSTMNNFSRDMQQWNRDFNWGLI